MKFGVIAFFGLAAFLPAVKASSPTIAINGAPASANQGSTLNLSVSCAEGSYPMTTIILSYSWDNTNWTQLAATPSPSNPSDTIGNPLALNHYGTLYLKGEVWDSGGDDVVTSATVSVHSVPPTVVINGAPSSANQGSTLNLSVTGTEGSNPMTTLILSYSWDNSNWTQLAATPSPSNPTDTHGNPLTLTQYGTLYIKGEVWDSAGNDVSTTATVTVNSVPPTIVINAPSSEPVGTVVDLSATGTKGSTNLTTLILSYSWDNSNWTQLGANPNPSNPTDTEGNQLQLSQAGTLYLKAEVWDAAGNYVVTTANVISYLFDWGNTPSSVPSGTQYNVNVGVSDGGGFPLVTLYKNGAYFASGWYGTQGNTTDTGNTTVQYNATYSDSSNGTSGSDSRSVSIYDTAPTITTQPASESVNQGSAASFTVGASGASTFTYQWRFNSVDISGATSATYSISSAQPANQGTYDCIVSDSVGSATSNGATLTVYTPPTITSGPQNQAVDAGTSVTFSVTATGNPAPSYQWQFNGTNINGATSASLAIANVQTGNAGNYDVVVDNVAGSATSSTATLTVNTAPLPPVITSASIATAMVNSAFSYSITASNNPTGYGAGALPPGLSVSPTTGIISGTPTKAGTYNVTISATNAAGTASAGLTIDVTTMEITSSTNTSVEMNTSFTYTITASGNPTSFSASGLPPGLTLNGSTGVISGTPTTAATYSVIITASNAIGSGSDTLTIDVTATNNPELEIHFPTAP